MAVARAPGKIVISGAYAVLDGAPAIVSAVDRYVVADSERTAAFVTPEVRAAIHREQAPWFDAEALRAEGRKLGLGSSAAILVATLAALELEKSGGLDEAELQGRVFEPALVAHRMAQGGGSGIDVAASTFGGVIVCEPTDEALIAREVRLPSRLFLEVWACQKPAATSELIAQVKALKADDRATYLRLMSAQAQASHDAVFALEQGDATRFISALAAQRTALSALGTAACAPIVTPEIFELGETALENAAVFLPSGAGGGDIALFVGLDPSSESFRHAALRCGITQLSLRLGARGVHAES